MKKQTFKAEKQNGMWCVVAYPVVAYHMPAIIAEANSRVEALALAKSLNSVIA
jgi:hypothetical protein